MENKRGSGGFVSTMVGAVMTIVQSVYPHTFGDHPWILPAALLLLFIGLLFWLTQLAWMQKLLGIPRVDHRSQTHLPHPEPEAKSRLKIISAYWGVEGVVGGDLERTDC